VAIPGKGHAAEFCKRLILASACAHRHLLPPPTRLDTHRRCFPWADAHG